METGFVLTKEFSTMLQRASLQYGIGQLQAVLDELNRQLSALQNGQEAEVCHWVRPAAVGEYLEKVAQQRKMKGSRGWGTLTKEERSAEMARRRKVADEKRKSEDAAQELRAARWREMGGTGMAVAETVQPLKGITVQTGKAERISESGRKRIKAAAKASWAKLTPQGRAARIRKMTRARSAKKAERAASKR